MQFIKNKAFCYTTWCLRNRISTNTVTGMNIFFKSEPIIALCIKGDLNYSSPVTQNIITSVLEKAKQNQYIDPTFEINWLESYKNTTNYNSSSEEKFVKGLNLLFKKWPMFSNDIIFNKDFSRIVSAKFYLKTENIKSTNAQGSLMLHLRSLSSNAGISCFFMHQLSYFMSSTFKYGQVHFRLLELH